MRALRRRSALLSLAASLWLLPASPLRAQPDPQQATPPAAEPSLLGSRLERGFAVGFDAVVVRPLRVSALAIGAAAFVPAALLSSPGGWTHIRSVYDVFVSAPAEAAFGRRLGDL